MDERDDILRIEHIQKKKIEMELSRDQAILAQQEKAHENKINAKNMKVESHKRMDERQKNAKEEFDKREKIVEQVHSQKDKAHLAMEAQQ